MSCKGIIDSYFKIDANIGKKHFGIVLKIQIPLKINNVMTFFVVGDSYAIRRIYDEVSKIPYERSNYLASLLLETSEL